MPFRTRIAVRFGDEDHARIVYYPRTFHYLHVAFEDFFNEQGIPFRDLFEVDQLAFPLARAEAEFERPLRLGDQLDVDVWLERVGKRSATFAYRGRRAGDDADALRARLTVVCIELAKFASQDIPPRYRALFEANLAPPADATPTGTRTP